jgi:hypothetical protein
MSAQLRFASRMICLLAFGLIALMSGVKAHAQSVTLTSFGAEGYHYDAATGLTTHQPGGWYDDVDDKVNLNIAFNSIPSTGSFGYGVTVDVMYYSGPYASGTLLQSTTKLVYSTGGQIYPGNSNVSLNMFFNTPSNLRASEPAGTQSIIYIYHISGGAGGNGWSGNFSTYTGPNFLVHG